MTHVGCGRVTLNLGVTDSAEYSEDIQPKQGSYVCGDCIERKHCGRCACCPSPDEPHVVEERKDEDRPDPHLVALHEAGQKVLDKLMHLAAARYSLHRTRTNRASTSEDTMAAAQDFRTQEAEMKSLIESFCNLHDEWAKSLGG